MGETGSGKTTTSLSLCSDHDFRFISNERTSIDARIKKIISGTKRISISPMMAKTVPKFRKYIKDKGSWDRKILLSPQEIGIETEKDAKLEAIYFINSKQKEDFGFSSLESKFLIHKLYKECSALLNGSSFILFDYSKPAPDIDTEKMKEERIKAMKRILEEIKTGYLVGSTDKISSYIENAISN